MVGSVQQVMTRCSMSWNCSIKPGSLRQMSLGTADHKKVLKSMELFGTKIAPAVRKAIGARRTADVREGLETPFTKNIISIINLTLMKKHYISLSEATMI